MVRLINNTRQYLTISVIGEDNKLIQSEPVRIQGLGYCDVDENIVKSKIVQKYLIGSKPVLRKAAIPAKAPVKVEKASKVVEKVQTKKVKAEESKAKASAPSETKSDKKPQGSED